MQHEICGFENLHLHSDFSLLDGTGTVFEYAARAPKINQRFLCVTDHGMMGAIPQQIKACEEHGISPIFGCELYINPNQPEVTPGFSMSDFVANLPEADRKKMRKSYHITAIAYNTIGYENLVQLTSWGWLHGFYYKPRVNHQQLLKHKEGIIFCSGCYNGEIGQAFDTEGEDAAMAMIEKYLAMFGQYFYLEFMLLDFNKQKPYDIFLQKAHAKYGIPMVVTQDCHYCNQEDSLLQRNMLMVQTNKTVHDLEKAKEENADLFELQDQNLWMKSEDELNEFWSAKYTDAIDLDIFKQAKRNTVVICEQAKGVELDRSIKLPKLPNENEVLWAETLRGFKRRGLPTTKEYADRLKEEFNLIKDKEFASYFLIEKMMTDEARLKSPEILGFGDGSEAVGPGRGSACGSLLCYCLGITDVNPIPHGLLFSRFLSPARGGKSMKVRFTQQPVSAVTEPDAEAEADFF
jgi:DNA polymerase-3 subunit alpha